MNPADNHQHQLGPFRILLVLFCAAVEFYFEIAVAAVRFAAILLWAKITHKPTPPHV